MLLVALVAVVGLAKSLTPTVEAGIAWLGVPKAVVGIVIAAVVLPECLAALRAAQANRLQSSLNLALGSALAAIGLTIPTVALVSIVIGQPLELGLGEKDQKGGHGPAARKGVKQTPDDFSIGGKFVFVRPK